MLLIFPLVLASITFVTSMIRTKEHVEIEIKCFECKNRLLTCYKYVNALLCILMKMFACVSLPLMLKLANSLKILL